MSMLGKRNIFSMFFKESETKKRKLLNESQKNVNLEQLPEEILVHIFSFLPKNALLTMSETNKRYHRITSDNLLWKKVVQDTALFFPSNQDMALKEKYAYTQGRYKEDLSEYPPQFISLFKDEKIFASLPILDKNPIKHASMNPFFWFNKKQNFSVANMTAPIMRGIMYESSQNTLQSKSPSPFLAFCVKQKKMDCPAITIGVAILSYEYPSIRFKSYIGSECRDYNNAVFLKKIKKLITGEKLTKYISSFELCYMNQYPFAKQYRKETGMSIQLADQKTIEKMKHGI